MNITPLEQLIVPIQEWLEVMATESYSLMGFPYFLPGESTDKNWQTSLDVIIRLFKSNLIEPVAQCGVLDESSAQMLFKEMARYDPRELGDSPWFQWDFTGTDLCRSLVARFPSGGDHEHTERFLARIEKYFDDIGLPWGSDAGFYVDIDERDARLVTRC